MNSQICFAITLVMALTAAHAVDIPEDIPGAPGSGRDPGFIVRSAQASETAPAPEGDPLPATLNRGIFQLNGTLRDDEGTLIEDESIPGPNPDGSYSVEVINFEKDALVEDVDGNPDEGGGPVTNFPDNALFPGIPGTGGHTTNFVTEIVTYLELPAGEHTFGGQVWVERTDTGGDDFFVVSSGTHPRDYLNLEIAEYVKTDAPAFESVPNDFTYTFTAPADGLYPFRLVFMQDVRGAALEWYSVDAATGDKILINDPDDERAIKAFESSTATHHNHPYIAEIRPQPGSRGIPASDKLEILIDDDEALLDQSSVEIFLNGLDITNESTIDHVDGRTSISFQPNPGRTELGNDVRLLYQDTAGREFERTWSFEISGGVGVTRVTGHWDFNGDLSATTGRDMEYLSAGLEERTEFGTTTELDIPGINGEPAEVMVVPAAEGADTSIGYVMYHGIEPNGGGTRVNQYTLIMDVMIFEEGAGAAGIIQIDSPRPGADGVIPNSGDSDYFWQGNNMGQGQGGYEGDGSFTPGEWHRIVFAVDLAGDPRLVTKYVDGVKQDDWVQNSIDQPRRALLDEYAILFTDGDDGEQRGWYVNSVQIREGKMSDVEIELLAGPSAEGIPVSFFDDPNATLSTRNVFGKLGGDMGVQTRRLTVFNSGETEDLVIESVTPTGPESEFFTVVSFPETLASAEEGTIVVEFDPQGQAGLFEAALEVVSNDGGDPVLSIDVTARVDNPSGLVAHFSMDEADGTTMLDASGQRYHGSYGAAGTGSFTLDQDGLAAGRAVRFSDGGSPAAGGGGFGQLDANESIPSLQNLTISMWVQPDPADAGASMLLAKGTLPGDPFALATNVVGETNPLLWYVQENSEIETSPVLNVGETHHVVITHLDENGLELGSTRTRIYLDGQLIDEAEAGNGYEDVRPTVIQIGALNGGFGFTGVIDDVQIYSRELAADEVEFLFANPGESVDAPEVVPSLQDVTDPSDPIVLVNGENDGDENDGAPPAMEGVSNAINNIGQKYLNFLDLESGFIVTPQVGPTLVTGLRLFPANDAPERDPASYELWGSVTGPEADDFVLISEGPLALPEGRNEGGEVAINLSLPHQELLFENGQAFISYRLIFPTLKDADAANSMQIAEVELLGVTADLNGGGELIPGLLAYWPFDGDTSDASGNGHDGTLTNGATLSDDVPPGSSGQSLQISGGEQHVLVPHDDGLNITEELTIAAWVQPQGDAEWDGIIAKNPSEGSMPNHAGNYELRIENETRALHLLYQNGGVDDTAFHQATEAIVTGDTWSHVAVTAVKGGEVNFYINGELADTHADLVLESFGATNTSPVYIGSRADFFTVMDGLIDEVALFDRALSADEILAISQGMGLPPSDGGGGVIPGDVPQITGISLTAEGVALQLPAGVTYDVEYSVDLQNWSPIAMDVTGAFEDTDAARAGNPAGYYRGLVK